METRGIDQMLSELRSVSQVAQGKAVSPADAPAGGVNFADVLNNALKDVSAAQGEARAMAQNFSAGDPNVNLQDVMVNLQRPTSRSSRWFRCVTGWLPPTKIL
jgi:Flagellar hook-basal body complex protein FliE.